MPVTSPKFLIKSLQLLFLHSLWDVSRSISFFPFFSHPYTLSLTSHTTSGCFVKCSVWLQSFVWVLCAHKQKISPTCDTQGNQKLFTETGLLDVRNLYFFCSGDLLNVFFSPLTIYLLQPFFPWGVNFNHTLPAPEWSRQTVKMLAPDGELKVILRNRKFMPATLRSNWSQTAWILLFSSQDRSPRPAVAQIWRWATSSATKGICWWAWPLRPQCSMPP